MEPSHSRARVLNPGHVAALLAALAASLALHWVAMNRLPPLPIGRPAAYASQLPLPAVLIQEVLRDGPARKFEEPDRFRPEHPEQFVPLDQEQDAFRQEVERLQPEAAVIDPGLSAAQAPLADPAVPVSLATWEPRRDILQIEEKLYADNVSALPRHYTPAIPRQAVAPDIVLPVDAAGLAEGLAASALSGAPAGGTAARLNAPPVAPAPTVEVSPLEVVLRDDPVPDAAQTAIREQAALLDETPAEVSPVQAIEQLLALDVSVFQPPGEDAFYFRIALHRNGAEALPVLPRDIVFLQDCSESMTQTKILFFREGLYHWLEDLAPFDRLNVIKFSETPVACFPELRSVMPDNLGMARRFVEGMVARGRTDFFTPLQDLLRMPIATERPLLGILLTDGRPTMGMVDSSDIIVKFSDANQGRFSIFAVGVGDRVNRFLLELLSYNNRGASWIGSDRRLIPEIVRDAAHEISRPVLAGLAYRFVSAGAPEAYPQNLTHLYLDRPLEIFGRTPAAATRTAFQVVGQSGPRRHDLVFEVDWQTAQQGSAEIQRQWVMHKIYHLIGVHIRTGDPAVMAQIRELADTHAIPLPYGGDIPLP